MDMFCRQCEQVSQGSSCTKSGVCGKSPEVSNLQDLLVYALEGIAVYGKMAQDLGVKDKAVDRFLVEGLFDTVTNVNFDPQRLEETIRKAYTVKEQVKKSFLKAYQEKEGKKFDGQLTEAVNWKPADTRAGLLEQSRTVGILSNPGLEEDNQSLRELLLYNLKGMAAYADHASLLGHENETVNSFFYKGLAALTDMTFSTGALIDLNMEFGKVNLACLAMLDKAHTGRFGSPVPTKVFWGNKKGPAIIVSGHDLLDLEQLLRQTEGRGINIYTHGEMLPAHGYPELKKYKHLVGHFGTAWQNQKKEFDAVPAAVLMTTNCIQKPLDSYLDRIFTTGLVGWPGAAQIEGQGAGKDFSAVIEKSLQLGGFTEETPGQEVMVGFGHDALLSAAPKVIGAVADGSLKHFFLIGGCDGAKPGRNYFTELAQKVPADSVILTLACGKFRFNHLDFGDINGIPRLLDCGQCNDAYSAIVVATELAKAFNCSVNDLPLSIILSWYEQKAVCILTTLLSLGIKNIRLGPSLPAFISPGVLKVLSENFNIRPTTTPEQDLQEMLKK
ncbi:MAG: hydroxylamine reductase [Candidatus Omnitrophica bacterium]|nr:hydroxylamine reductase [Candidatus Omnitrophota bacterium]